MILSPPLWATGAWVDDSWADDTWSTELVARNPVDPSRIWLVDGRTTTWDVPLRTSTWTVERTTTWMVD